MGFLRDVANFVTFGAIDQIEASSIVNSAKEREAKAKEELNEAKHDTQLKLEKFGSLKEDIYSNSLNKFVLAYDIIGKVDLSPLKKNYDEKTFNELQVEIVEIGTVSTKISELAIAGGGAALGGTVAVYGALGVAGIIGTASTGTAIGTLTGVAAQNATLAWLGGGTIASGGAGVAGGLVVLGGIAIAPAILLGMFLCSNKGKQALDNANEYYDQIDVVVKKTETVIAELAQIRRGCFLMSEAIKSLDAVLSEQVIEMDKIAYRLQNRSSISKYIIDPIKKRIFNLSLLKKDEVIVFCDAVNSASLLKQLIDKPLMNEKGAFLSEVLDFLDNKKNDISAITKKINCSDSEEKVNENYTYKKAV